MMMFVAAAAMMFAACGKDDDNNGNNGGNSSGNAEVASTTWVGYQGNPQSDDNYATYALTFNSDNSCAMSIAFYAASEGGHYATTHFTGTYTFSGNGGTMTLTDDIAKEVYNDTFTINGNTLTLTHGRVSVTMDKSNTVPQIGIADNTVVYDGVTYSCVPGATVFPNGEPGFIQYVLYSQDYTLHLEGGLYQSAHNRTFDLTQHHDDLEFHFHLGIENGVLDVQWSDNPNNLWCFLDGDNMNTSCFSSGTATVTVDGLHLTIVVDGTLVNGKALKLKIVTDCQESM